MWYAFVKSIYSFNKGLLSVGTIQTWTNLMPDRANSPEWGRPSLALGERRVLGRECRKTSNMSQS